MRLRGTVNVNGQTLGILGVPVELDVTTPDEDTVPLALRRYSPTDLRTGDLIEVHGYQPASGANTVRARIVECRPTREPFKLRGFPTNVVRPTLAILGATVTATPGIALYSDAARLRGRFPVRQSADDVERDATSAGELRCAVCELSGAACASRHAQFRMVMRKRAREVHLD